MLARLLRQLKSKKAIQFREWYSDARLARSGVSSGISFTR